MSSSFYGNRRFFETNFKALNVSPCKSLQAERACIYQRSAAASMVKPSLRTGLRRSFSLQDKTRKNTNSIQRADLSKKQSKSCKLTSSQTKDNNSRLEKSVDRPEHPSPLIARFGSFSRQRSVDETSISEVDYSIYVHGYCGVGKSTLVHQLPYVFSANEIFDFGREHRAEIFVTNTNGSYRFKEIDVLYKRSFKDADIHLVVFAMDDIVSMKYAIDRVTFLRWKCRIQSPIFIIGNKCDKIRRKPNFERDVEFITKKLSCQYLRLPGISNDSVEVLKAAMETVFMENKDDCCTPNKKNVFKRLFKCFFSLKRR